MTAQGLIQELQYRALLQPQGLHDGQDALDEATARLTVAAEGILAPQHSRAQQALDVIIGRLYPFVIKKGPQSRFHVEQVPTKRCRLVIATVRTLLQPTPHRFAERLQFE